MTQPFWQTADGMLDHASQFASDAFRMVGEVRPMFIAVARDGDEPSLMVIACEWKDDDEKAQVLAGARRLFAEHSVERYAFLSEAWTVVMTEREFRQGKVPPSKSDQRQEVLHVMVCDTDGAVKARTFPILRDEKGARLGQPGEPIGGPSAGRLTELLSGREQ